ncbi:unnamed protein product [Ambrosiozyma monospora]|uniref:Unnamed protein product n=1 Tax=Ambrosiozyma monospora TaxID=43982 RepID=A0ACB5T1R9_AMBMO|nr:unnamed protein product [Ambrosiozyma monospora]
MESPNSADLLKSLSSVNSSASTTNSQTPTQTATTTTLSTSPEEQQNQPQPSQQQQQQQQQQEFLNSQKEFREFIEKNRIAEELAADETTLYQNPQFLKDLISNYETYVEKLNWQLQELGSKERFLRLVDQGSVLTPHQEREIDQLNKQLRKAYEAQERQLEQFKKHISAKCHKMIKLLDESITAQTQGVAFEEELKTLRERTAEIERKTNIEIGGEFSVGSVAELQTLIDGLQKENAELELKGTVLDGEKEGLMEKDRKVEEELAELQSEVMEKKSELEKWENVKKDGKQADLELVKQAEYLNELMRIMKQFDPANKESSETA